MLVFLVQHSAVTKQERDTTETGREELPGSVLSYNLGRRGLLLSSDSLYFMTNSDNNSILCVA